MHDYIKQICMFGAMYGAMYGAMFGAMYGVYFIKTHQQTRTWRREATLTTTTAMSAADLLTFLNMSMNLQVTLKPKPKKAHSLINCYK